MIWMNLNISLDGNNPYTSQEIIDLLNTMFPTDALINYRKVLVDGDVGTQAILVVRLNTYDYLSRIISKLETLTKLMNQRCIAVRAESFELLVYQPEIPERKKVMFSEKKFHNFYTEETIEAIEIIAKSGA